MIGTKSDLNLLRKLWHCFPGIALVYFIDQDIWSVSQVQEWLVKLFIIGLLFDRARLTNKNFNDKVLLLFKRVMRREEVNNPSGLPSYIGAVAILLIFFPEKIALIAILQLAIVDPFASLGGLSFRGTSINLIFSNNKSLMGLASGFVVGMLATGGILLYWGLSFSEAFTFSFFGVLSASLIESFPPFNLNDNWSVPIFAGLVFSFLNMFMEVL